MGTSDPQISRTLRGMAFMVRYGGALIAFAPLILMRWDLIAYPAQIVPISFFALAGVFCLTAAEMEAFEQVVKYRRFLFWKVVAYQEIVRCKDSWIPGFAYLKLAGFVLPWGKIYFVTLRPAFTGNPRDLVALVNSRWAQHQIPPPGDNFSLRDGKKDMLFCGLMCCVGFIATLMWAYLSPGSFRPEQLEGFPHWVTSIRLLYSRAESWPWSLGTVAILLAIIFRLHFKDRAWILAMVVGTLLGSIVVGTLR